jgi:hypothetical protein
MHEPKVSSLLFDLTKRTELGLPLSACPYYIATDGNPPGGTATCAEGEVGFWFDCESAEHENEIFCQRIHLSPDAKLYFRSGDGVWELWDCPSRTLTLTGKDAFSGTEPAITAMRIECAELHAEWVGRNGEPFGA